MAVKKRNAVAAVLILLSFVILIPGLTRDLITISASLTVLGQSNEIFDASPLKAPPPDELQAFYQQFTCFE